MNREITFISSNVKGIQNSDKRIKNSCRVAICGSKTIEQTKKISDKSGRILLVEVKIDDTVFVLINIYNANTELE